MNKDKIITIMYHTYYPHSNGNYYPFKEQKVGKWQSAILFALFIAVILLSGLQ